MNVRPIRVGATSNSASANTDGGRTCTCIDGFVGDGESCADVDECQVDNGGCDANATCTNTTGGRVCACNPGYEGTGERCFDVDECQVDNGGCDANARCTNTDGGRKCVCADGFEGDGETCADVDECRIENGGCEANAGQFTCTCDDGYEGGGLNTPCTDIDECLVDNGGCQANWICTNLEGSFECAACPECGCTDEAACNYDAEATLDDESCLFAEVGFNCDGEAEFVCGDQTPYDGFTYSSIQVGEQCWLVENLKYLPQVDGETKTANEQPTYHVYNYSGTDVEAAKQTSFSNSNVYDSVGVLYNWYAVSEDDLCPPGFLVPSENEVNTLLTAIDGNGGLKNLWGPQFGGAVHAQGNTGFLDYGSYGYWWTRTQRLSATAKLFYIWKTSNILEDVTWHSKTGAFSVRCILDDASAVILE